MPFYKIVNLTQIRLVEMQMLTFLIFRKLFVVL